MLTFQFVALIDRVAHECDVAPADILSKSRATKAADARSIAIYCTRQVWGASYGELSRLFDRSKPGVYALEQRTMYLMEYDKRVQGIVNRVMEIEATL